MFDDAYKQQPANEDLGCQTFFANARVNNWKTAQQVSAAAHDLFDQSHPVMRLQRRCSSNLDMIATFAGMP
jgi:hypothetical protein